MWHVVGVRSAQQLQSYESLGTEFQGSQFRAESQETLTVRYILISPAGQPCHMCVCMWL